MRTIACQKLRKNKEMKLRRKQILAILVFITLLVLFLLIKIGI
jgi:hypothetical protein